MDFIDPINKSGARWSPDPGVCAFDPERTEENRAYLERVLGVEWLRRGITSPGHENHPVLSDWAQQGPAPYVSVNVLAEDLRVLEGVPGLDVVLEDLRNAVRSQPARHTLHSAALYARAPGTVVERFYQSSGPSVPDFDVDVGGNGIAVETKQLLKSEAERAFAAAAVPLMGVVMEHGVPAGVLNPEVFVIVKDAARLPSTDHVLSGVRRGLQEFAGEPWVLRSKDVNLLFMPPQPGMATFQGCHILAPRSPGENLKAISRGKDASAQLEASATGDRPGVLHLALTERQDPLEVRSLFLDRFARGRSLGISALVLSHSGVHPYPPTITYVDALGVVVNPSARRSLRTRCTMRPAWQAVDLFADTPFARTVAAYRVFHIGGTLGTNPDGFVLGARAVVRLTPELLA